MSRSDENAANQSSPTTDARGPGFGDGMIVVRLERQQIAATD